MVKYEQMNDIPVLLYIIVFGLGVWGAILNYFKREDDIVDRTPMQKVGIFILDLISSMGLSVVTFLSLLGLGLNDIIAVAFAGWVAHQGTRAIYLVELIISEKLGSNAMRDAIIKEKEGKK